MSRKGLNGQKHGPKSTGWRFKSYLAHHFGTELGAPKPTIFAVKAAVRR
jgi:hypothetical protein